jgi:putative ABC transport system permease protein
VESLLQDIRFGLRILLRTPALTCTILLALALGIGANTAMFSVVDAVLLHRLHFPDPSELTLVSELDPRGLVSTASAANYLDWRSRSQSFTDLAGWTSGSYIFTGGDHPEQLSGAAVTANFFKTLGAKPVLGRTFLSGEDGIDNPADASRVVVISYSMWQDQLGGDPNVLSRILRLNQIPYRVIGVMPKDFQILVRRHALWVPVNLNRANRDYRLLTVIGRLKRPRLEAAAEMTTLGRSLASAYPKSNKDWQIQVYDLRDWLVKNVHVRLLLLAGALGLLLLIACFNVASLLLVRLSARSGELAVRIALGATSGRIIRQLLMESLFLFTAGGVLGLGLASFLIEIAPRILPAAALPAGALLELSPTVLLFTLAISLGNGILCGITQALLSSRGEVHATLRDSSRGATAGHARQLFRECMVVLELAVALVLVSTAALMIQSMRHLDRMELGFRLDNVLIARIFLPAVKYDAEHALALQRRMLDRISALPGVEGATIGTILPLMPPSEEVPFDLENQPPKELGDRPGAGYVGVGQGYLQTLGIPVRRGRMFTDTDNRTAPPVVIVNEAFATRYFPGEDPVGKHILLNRPILGKDDFEDSIHPEIVGVIGDVKSGTLSSETAPILYAPNAQNLWSAGSWLAIRTTQDPTGLIAAVRRQVFELDPDLPVERAGTLEQFYDNQFAEPRFQSQLMGAFAAIALALAVVGIYGVNAYSVAQRAKEIAVRLALGASSVKILSEAVRRGLKLASIGIALGLAGAYLAARLLSSLLVGVKGQDPVILGGTAILLACVAGIACYFPARRAIRIEPASALRSD